MCQTTLLVHKDDIGEGINDEFEGLKDKAFGPMSQYSWIVERCFLFFFFFFLRSKSQSVEELRIRFCS